MPLSDSAIRAAKPRDEAYEMADGGGLCLSLWITGDPQYGLHFTGDPAAISIITSCTVTSSKLYFNALISL
jgi:hypothetical protein